MRALTIAAPAKLNLHLRIKERRPDGFHDLESIFIALDFGDTLCFEPLEGENALEISMKGPQAGGFGLAGEKNIIFKAISLFRERTGFLQGLRVTTEKRIPLGGGLGGGSSNGASTLLAMNALAAAEGRSLNEAALAELAASLGSDVPFFLCETGAAWVSGRGERVKPLQAPSSWAEGLFFVLVNPGFASNTAAAYRLLDEKRANSYISNVSCTKKQANSSNEDLIRSLAAPPAAWPFENDFLPAFLRSDSGNTGPAEAYRKILSQLREAGADFSSLSGSGATCFGVFTNETAAQKTMAFLSKLWFLTKAAYPLAQRAKPVVK
jgi:4-diphosphocytidyl-2-C-methyl-D-erythritol kinase